MYLLEMVIVALGMICSGLFLLLCLSLVLTFALAYLFVVNLGEQGNKAETAEYSFIQWAACIFGILTHSGIRIPGYPRGTASATKNLAATLSATHNLSATHSSAAAAARKAKTATTPNNRAAKRPSRPSRLITRTTATTVGKHETSHSYSLVDSTLRDIQGNVDQQAVMTQPTNVNSAISLFPLPYQMGAPYFDGKDVTDFIAHWEDLTIDWTDSQRIKKVPLYCEKLIGKYLKTFETYISGASWDEFRAALVTTFKEDDMEQKKNTETYLQSLVQGMQKTKDPSVARYRAFIFEFAERSTLLVSKLIINEHTRVFMFLQAFSDKIGDKLCKRCSIDIDDTASTAKVWNELRKEALSVCTKDDSQMSKLWKAKKQMESPTHTRMTKGV